MTDRSRRRPTRPDAPNIHTEHQKEGDATRPRDVLDRTPRRDPQSGATIPDDYEPENFDPENMPGQKEGPGSSHFRRSRRM